MRRAAILAALLGLAPLASPATARADDPDSIFTNTGADLTPREHAEFRVNGYLRTRGEALDNFDLDRGLTPSGQSLFPVPLGTTASQWLESADMRLRTDLAFYAPGGMVAVKVRADVLDNLALGSLPQGVPSASTTQTSPSNLLRIKRAWGEVLTPFGVIAAGRMGNQWGLGMVANSGDCLDCDSGDAADRIAFVTPLFGHIWAVAYDFTAIGPTVQSKDGTHLIDVEPSARTNSVTVAVIKYKDDLSRERRRKAGRTTFEYGAFFSYRSQDNDVPAWYVPATDPAAVTSGQVMTRGFQAYAIDGWARLTMPELRIQAEAALQTFTEQQDSLIAGVEMRDPVSGLQWGAALESEIGAPERSVHAGIDLGIASGDPAPGFGAYPSMTGAAPQPGDLDGAQARPPYDNRIDNFRFNPDYRIDRILWREIIGTVTDAFYLRPHVSWKTEIGPGQLLVSLAGVASFALYASSTPGGNHALGVELDPTIAYESRYGFQAAFEYGVLFPMAGLDNPELGLSAKPAQMFRLRLTYVF
jgi:uncharacterized protein (TIGR04551 family)